MKYEYSSSKRIPDRLFVIYYAIIIKCLLMKFTNQSFNRCIFEDLYLMRYPMYV